MVISFIQQPLYTYIKCGKFIFFWWFCKRTWQRWL